MSDKVVTLPVIQVERYGDEPDPDAGAKRLAEWIGYSWDGMRDERIVGYPQWAFNGIGKLHFQGGKQDLRDLAAEIAALSSGQGEP